MIILPSKICTMNSLSIHNSYEYMCDMLFQYYETQIKMNKFNNTTN